MILRIDQIEMGGDGAAATGDFRTKVWSMPGGPNCRPVHWKRNTAIAMVGIIITCIPIAMISVKLEVHIHTCFLYAVTFTFVILLNCL